MSKKQKNGLIRIFVAAGLFALALLLPLSGLPRFFAFLAVYAFVAWDILYEAVRNILRGQVFDENFLMAVASIGAMALADYPEAVAVVLFYQVGEWFQGYAVGRSRRDIAKLMDIRPDHANLLNPDGSLSVVEPDAVKAGDIIIVKPGERVPLDAVVQKGASALDTSSLTGESVPRDVEEGSEVTSGCINLTGALECRVKCAYSESTVARILELVESSGANKAKAEHFITRFARVYTPLVCGLALALALLPPLITGQPFSDWIYRALTFLVISCPCALVISVPLSFFGGIGGASKLGVLIKGGNYLEALAKAGVVVFDKTGTLTKGSFEVRDISARTMDKPVLLELAAVAESYSTHPIARSIVEAYGKTVDQTRASGVSEVAGRGVRAVVDGKTVLAGNTKLMDENGVAVDAAASEAAEGTAVHLAVDGVYAGRILVADAVRPDAKEAIAQLMKIGVAKTVMLTGDADGPGRAVAGALGISEVHTKLLPSDKVEQVERLLAAPHEGTVAFVGDGVNDAPVLARADVGVAMGGLGSDAAIEAADVVIMTDEPSKLPAAIQISRRTMAIVKQNIVFALGVKALVLALGALGIAGMWMAVFADVGVSVIAILNAMRAMRVKRSIPAPPAAVTPDRTPEGAGEAA